MTRQDAPPVAALFQVIFDQKVGYTISWKQCLPDLDVDGVEYQCLPSGLHSVREDLVYFVHGEYAGVSAFVREEADKHHRNASFVAVGALVSLKYGKLGKSWMHAEALKSLAHEVVQDLENKQSLEQFWERHGVDGQSYGVASVTPQTPSTGDSERKRSLSDAPESLTSGRSLEKDHPALSMPDLLETLGPLLFPLYRQALIQKRILLIGSTPVRPACNYVYDLSVLSTVPQYLQGSIAANSAINRLEPLFNVGVFDMTRLESHGEGWLACTTDDILGEKKKLYDILVEMPTSPAVSGHKLWPSIRTPDGEIIKATQRDFRRYASLRRGLRRLQRGDGNGMHYRDDESDTADDDQDDSAPLVRPSRDRHSVHNDSPHGAEASIVEQATWSTMAYESFMWWASAGEKDSLEAEEILTDRALLDDLPDLSELPGQDHPDDNDSDRGAQRAAATLVAYFHRVTGVILQTLANIIERADDDTAEGYEEDAVEVSEDDLRRIGLDAWNARDRAFVQDVLKLYFNRRSVIEDDGVRMCGVRIC